MEHHLTFSVDGVGMLVGLGSLHRQLPLDSGQNLAILIQYRVPGVGSFFKLWVSLVLRTKKQEMVVINLTGFKHLLSI